MDTKTDDAQLAKSLQLMTDFGEFQYKVCEARYLINVKMLPWSKTEIIDAIKDVLLNIDDSNLRETAFAQLQCIPSFQDFFNDEIDKVCIDDLFENRLEDIRDNRELLERFKDEMHLMIDGVNAMREGLDQDINNHD